jgi:hypothetical protein
MRGLLPGLASSFLWVLTSVACVPSRTSADAGADGGPPCWVPPSVCDAGSGCKACIEASQCYWNAVASTARRHGSCDRDSDCELVDGGVRCPNGFPLEPCSHWPAIAIAARTSFAAERETLAVAICDSLGSVCSAPTQAIECLCAWFRCRPVCLAGVCQVETTGRQ